ncbi:hypothetical protein GF340_04025, partial [Candidatus Peregrinibacteria bacterium]|nr:hypothetical protein [Candidatus Peregrinibacteria bacterium]
MLEGPQKIDVAQNQLSKSVEDQNRSSLQEINNLVDDHQNKLENFANSLTGEEQANDFLSTANQEIANIILNNIQESDETDAQELEQMKQNLNSELSEQKAEINKYRKLSEVQSAFNSIKESEKITSANKADSIKKYIQEYQNLSNDLNGLEGNLPGQFSTEQSEEVRQSLITEINKTKQNYEKQKKYYEDQQKKYEETLASVKNSDAKLIKFDNAVKEFEKNPTEETQKKAQELQIESFDLVDLINVRLINNANVKAIFTALEKAKVEPLKKKANQINERFKSIDYSDSKKRHYRELIIKAEQEIKKIKGLKVSESNSSLLASSIIAIEKYKNQLAKNIQNPNFEKDKKMQAEAAENEMMLKSEIEATQETVAYFAVIDKAENHYKNNGEPASLNVEKVIAEKNDETKLERREKILASITKAMQALAEGQKILTEQEVPENATDISDRIAKELFVSKAEKLAEKKSFYDVMDAVQDEKSDLSEYVKFNEDTLALELKDKNIPPEKAAELIKLQNFAKLKNMSEYRKLATNNEYEKAFIEGQEALAKKDMMGAKLLFLKAIKAENNNLSEQEKYLAKEALKSIALQELEEANGKVNALHESLSGRNVGFGLDLKHRVGVNPHLADSWIEQNRKVVDEAKKLIENGKALTIAEAYNQIKKDPRGSGKGIQAFQNGFAFQGQRFEIFDVLKIQAQISAAKTPEERKQLLLEQARKARELGLPVLAQKHIETYFADEIASQEVTWEEAKNKVTNDKDNLRAIEAQKEFIKKQIKEQMTAQAKKVALEETKKQVKEFLREDYDESNPKHMALFNKIYKEPKDSNVDHLMESKKIEERLLNKAIETAIYRRKKEKLHQTLKGGNYQGSDVWNEFYGNTFVNIDTLDTGYWSTWYKFSDSEWNTWSTFLVANLAVIIASVGAGMMVSGGMT